MELCNAVVLTLFVALAFQGAIALPSEPKSADFECQSEGGYYPHPVNCELYYGCGKDFVATLYHCPEKQLFDLRYSGCNYPELTDCQNRTRPPGYPPTTTPPSNETPPPPYPCPADLADELFPDSNDCSGYFRCVWGVSYYYKCATPLLFNEKTKTCDWKQNVECGSRPIP